MKRPQCQLDVEQAMKMIAGSARSMGLEVQE